MMTPITQELLFRYFAGQATPFQKQLVEEWSTQPGNQEEFFAWLDTYERTQPQFVPDASAAITRHQQRMRQSVEAGPAETTVPVYALPTNRTWGRWLVAASAGLLLFFGWLLRDTISQQTYATGYGETRTLILPDGSRATLNANSTLRVARFGFDSQTRLVRLTGEVAFSVSHTSDDQPFVVRMGRNVDVVVLGTEFVVSSRQQGERVVLNRGRVRVRYQQDGQTRQLLMVPGDQVTVPVRGRPQLRKLAKPENVLAWRDNRYVFDKTPLTDIAQLFHDNYGVELRFADATVAHWTVSGSFAAHTADELLESLVQASGLNYARIDNEITITNSAN